MLGVSEDLARRLAREGRLPGAFQVNRRWVVHRAVFLDALERMARGELPEQHDSDRLLLRSLDEVRLRASQHRVG